jgi:hypothetical protein
MEKYKWSYGRKPKNNKVFDTEILLPILHNQDGTITVDSNKIYSQEGYIPDFKYMEEFVESLPYGDLL